jgi:hypothetical protein
MEGPIMANIRLPDVEHFVLEWAGSEVGDRADAKHLHRSAPGVENVAFDVVHCNGGETRTGDVGQ